MISRAELSAPEDTVRDMTFTVRPGMSDDR
jgi:hypothetical protein